MAGEADRQSNPFGQGYYWRSLIWIIVVFLVVAIWMRPSGEEDEQIPYTRFKEAVAAGRVDSVTVEGSRVEGLYVPATEAGAEGQPQSRPFQTVIPPFEDPGLMELLERNQVAVTARPAEDPWWSRLLIVLLPWVLILGLVLWAMRRLQSRVSGAGGEMFGFAKSKAKRFREGSTGVSFDDVAGLENAKRDLQEITGYLKDPRRYRALGAKIPRGILLMGPPGTGKTLLAKAVAGEADVPFYSISASEFIEMFVGVGAARVRDMFEGAKKEAPAIIFVDELDSVGRARGTGLGGGHDEREQTLNQILSEMDGFAPHEAVVVLAATNRPDVLDPALLRPGRFDRKVTLELPQRQARLDILKVHTRNVPLADDVDLGVIAGRTVGFSGADIENLVNEAALLAGREHQEKVDMQALTLARDKIVLGAEREGLLNDEEREVVAYHEAGHALLAHVLPEADPLDKVTIMPRGRALGATEQLPVEEHHNVRYGYLLDRIAVMLGGRVSEKIVFDEVTTGAEADLKQATQLVRRMVAHWGMSERIGPAAFHHGEESVFLGRELAQAKDFSEHTAWLIDEEIGKVLREQENRAREHLERHRAALDALARSLVEHETVDAAALGELVSRAEGMSPGS